MVLFFHLSLKSVGNTSTGEVRSKSLTWLLPPNFQPISLIQVDTLKGDFRWHLESSLAWDASWTTTFLDMPGPIQAYLVFLLIIPLVKKKKKKSQSPFSTGNRTGVLMLNKQVLFHLSHAAGVLLSSLFFSHRISHFCSGQSHTLILVSPLPE
jgi:hypothetical protein